MSLHTNRIGEPTLAVLAEVQLGSLEGHLVPNVTGQIHRALGQASATAGTELEFANKARNLTLKVSCGNFH